MTQSRRARASGARSAPDASCAQTTFDASIHASNFQSTDGLHLNWHRSGEARGLEHHDFSQSLKIIRQELFEQGVTASRGINQEETSRHCVERAHSRWLPARTRRKQGVVTSPVSSVSEDFDVLLSMQVLLSAAIHRFAGQPPFSTQLQVQELVPVSAGVDVNQAHRRR